MVLQTWYSTAWSQATSVGPAVPQGITPPRCSTGGPAPSSISQELAPFNPLRTSLICMFLVWTTALSPGRDTGHTLHTSQRRKEERPAGATLLRGRAFLDGGAALLLRPRLTGLTSEPQTPVIQPHFLCHLRIHFTKVQPTRSTPSSGGSPTSSRGQSCEDTHARGPHEGLCACGPCTSASRPAGAHWAIREESWCGACTPGF